MRFLFSTFYVLALLSSPKADAMEIDEWQKGTIQVLDTATVPVLEIFEAYQEELKVLNKPINRLFPSDLFEGPEQTACLLVLSWVSLRDAISDYKQRTGLTWLIEGPPSTEALTNQFYSVLETSSLYSGKEETCASLQPAFVKMIVDGTGTYLELRKALRPSKASYPLDWSQALTVELTPLPFKIEAIQGSLRARFTGRLGPLKLEYQAGGQVDSVSIDHNLKHLIIRTSENFRVFDIEGKTFEIDVPASRITLKGRSLVVTCDDLCEETFVSFE